MTSTVEVKPEGLLCGQNVIRALPQPDEGQGEQPYPTTPAELREYTAAIRQGWPVTDAIRQQAINAAVAILEDPSATRRLGAIKAIILADSLNVRREATASAERTAEASAAATALRAALSDPSLRQALAQIQSPQPLPTSSQDTNNT